MSEHCNFIKIGNHYHKIVKEECGIIECDEYGMTELEFQEWNIREQMKSNPMAYEWYCKYKELQAFQKAFDSKMVYSAIGGTPEQAFKNIWETMRFTEGYMVRKEADGLYKVRLSVLPPNEYERRAFEKEINHG